MDKLNVTRIRNVKLPSRSTKGSCGYDITVPVDLVRLDFNKMASITKTDPRIDFDPRTGYLKTIYVQPGESVLIPSGLKIRVPDGHVLKVENKSSVASVKGLVVGACIIDNDYTGEILIDIHNVSKNKVAVLQPNDKMAQLVLYKIDTPEVNEVSTPMELFKDLNSDRGEGGFGSTGA